MGKHLRDAMTCRREKASGKKERMDTSNLRECWKDFSCPDELAILLGFYEGMVKEFLAAVPSDVESMGGILAKIGEFDFSLGEAGYIYHSIAGVGYENEEDARAFLWNFLIHSIRSLVEGRIESLMGCEWKGLAGVLSKADFRKTLDWMWTKDDEIETPIPSHIEGSEARLMYELSSGSKSNEYILSIYILSAIHTTQSVEEFRSPLSKIASQSDEMGLIVSVLCPDWTAESRAGL
jgi:hypothetical protein